MIFTSKKHGLGSQALMTRQRIYFADGSRGANDGDGLRICECRDVHLFRSQTTALSSDVRVSPLEKSRGFLPPVLYG